MMLFLGPPNDRGAALEFIWKMFADLNQSADRVVFMHFTCERNIGKYDYFFPFVKDTILQQALKYYKIRN